MTPGVLGTFGTISLGDARGGRVWPGTNFHGLSERDRSALGIYQRGQGCACGAWCLPGAVDVLLSVGLLLPRS